MDRQSQPLGATKLFLLIYFAPGFRNMRMFLEPEAELSSYSLKISIAFFS